MRTLLHVRPIDSWEIYDLSGVRVGNVDTLMLDMASGTVRFAWASFFAVSSGQVVLPWGALSYSRVRTAFITLVTGSLIKSAPKISGDALARDAEQLLLDHYRVGASL